MCTRAARFGERLLIALARKLEPRAQATPGRARVRSALRRRALRAWRATHAPLILCFGNINRSPFAAALARRDRLRPAGARSAGFFPEPGRCSPAATVAAAARYGVDLSGHRSSCVTRAELAGAAAIFVFDLENVARVAASSPAALWRLHLVGSLDDDRSVLIADPHGRGDAALDQTLARIARRSRARRRADDRSAHRTRRGLRRLQRLGQRDLDQPAPSDVAARGLREPGAVHRVARPAPPGPRPGRDLRGSCAGCGAAWRRRGSATACTCSRH